MWGVTKLNVLNEKRHSIKLLYFNNKGIRNNDNLAKYFNKYFIKSFYEIYDSIPHFQNLNLNVLRPKIKHILQ